MHMHTSRSRSFSLHPSPRTFFVARPPRSCEESLYPANDTRGSPSSWLVPRGCSAFPNIHETTSRCLHVRTHASAVQGPRGERIRSILILAKSNLSYETRSEPRSLSLLSFILAGSFERRKIVFPLRRFESRLRQVVSRARSFHRRVIVFFELSLNFVESQARVSRACFIVCDSKRNPRGSCVRR